MIVRVPITDEAVRFAFTRAVDGFMGSWPPRFTSRLEHRALLYPVEVGFSADMIAALAAASQHVYDEREAYCVPLWYRSGEAQEAWKIELTWADYSQWPFETLPHCLLSVTGSWAAIDVEEATGLLGASDHRFNTDFFSRVGQSAPEMLTGFVEMLAPLAEVGIDPERWRLMLEHVLGNDGADETLRSIRG